MVFVRPAINPDLLPQGFPAGHDGINPLCADARHCSATAIPTCQLRRATCNGLPASHQTPQPMQAGSVHPVTACTSCRDHGSLAFITELHRFADHNKGNPNAPPAGCVQLCKSCIKDEVKLYWQREGRPCPIGPRPQQGGAVAAPSLEDVGEQCSKIFVYVLFAHIHTGFHTAMRVETRWSRSSFVTTAIVTSRS